MNEERATRSLSSSGAALPPELQQILGDLQSPDPTTRACAVRALCPCRGVEWGVPIFRYVKEMRHDPSPVVRRAVRHDLKENPWWSERHEVRPDTGPHPRTVKVTLAVKGMALSDLCGRLHGDTGVPLVVEPSLADDKVTLFCERTPLRDVLRQLSRALGYVWVLRRKDDAYRQELIRDPHSPRLNDLRERDRAEGLPGAAVDTGLARDRAFRRRVNLTPSSMGINLTPPAPFPNSLYPAAVGFAAKARQGPLLAGKGEPAATASTSGSPFPSREGGRGVRSTRMGSGGEVNPRLTSADVLEALHQATGMPIVADFYTRLYTWDQGTLRERPLFDVLNHIAEVMGLRWQKDGDWFQFRSATFYRDRLMEVPNRLLARWAESRRRHGCLTLEDLVEIAQLPNAQLDSREMAEGAMELWGLTEWDPVRDRRVRAQLRRMAALPPEQREPAMDS